MKYNLRVILFCCLYGIGSYALQAQTFLEGQWWIKPGTLQSKDLISCWFSLTKSEADAIVCRQTRPNRYKFNKVVAYLNNKQNNAKTVIADGSQPYYYGPFPGCSLDSSNIGLLPDKTKITAITVGIIKATEWNSGFWFCNTTKEVTKSFSNSIPINLSNYTNYSTLIQPHQNKLVLLINDQVPLDNSPTIGVTDKVTLYAQYDFGNDNSFYQWQYNLTGNNSDWRDLAKQGKIISGTLDGIMNGTIDENTHYQLQPQKYRYRSVYFRLKEDAYCRKNGIIVSIVCKPKPARMHIVESSVTCNGDDNGKVFMQLDTTLSSGNYLKVSIFKKSMLVGSMSISGIKGEGSLITYPPITEKFPPPITAGDSFKMVYYQYMDTFVGSSDTSVMWFNVKQPDSTNFPRTIFANDYLLCAGTSGQTFISSLESDISGNGAPYYFWMHKEGAVDTIRRTLSNNTKYTFDGLMSGKYTYGGTDAVGCPASVYGFELKEPLIPSYKIMTDDSLGEFKTGAARCYGLDDSVKNIFVYNPRSTVAYYEMNTSQPERADGWWSSFYKHNSYGVNTDTFINPVFNLYGKLRDTTIVQLREWHIDKESGLTFTCPVYKRDAIDSLILKDSTRLIIDTVLFINEGVDIVGDTALMIKKDSAYFVLDTVVQADSGLYISNKKDTLYWDRDSVLYNNDSMYILQDTLFLNLYKTWTLSDSVFKIKDTIFVNRTNLLYTGDSFYICDDTVFLKRDSFIMHKPNLYILEDTLWMKKDSLICVDAKVNISNDTGYINKDSILLADESIYIENDTVWRASDSLLYIGYLIAGYRDAVDTGFVVPRGEGDSVHIGKYFALLTTDSLSNDSIVYVGHTMYFVVEDTATMKLYVGDTIYKIQDTGYLKLDTVFVVKDGMYLRDSILYERHNTNLYATGDSLYMVQDTLYVRREDSVIYVDAKLYILGDSLLVSQDSMLYVDSKLLLRNDSAFVNRDSSLFVGRYLYNRGDSIYWERNEHLYVSDKLYMVNDSTVKDKDSIVLIKPNLYKRGDSIILDSNVYHYKGDSIYREVDSFVVLKKQIAYIQGDSISRKADSLYVKNDSVYVMKRDTVSYFEWKDTLQLWQPSPLEVELQYLRDVLCYNDSNGRVSVQVTGGTTFKDKGQLTYEYKRNYTYWNKYIDSARGFTDTMLTAKEHVFNIADANKCTTKDSLVVYQPTKLEIDSIRSIQPVCFDDRTAEIVLYPRGGAVRYPLQYSIQWSPLDGLEEEVNNLMEDTLSAYRLKNVRSRASERVLTGVDYTATISDTNACKIVGKMRIVNPATLRITDKEITSACTGESNGTVSYSFGNTRGVVNIDFTSLPSKSVSGISKIKGLPEGSYPVLISDGSGVCAVYDTVNISSLSTQSRAIDRERYLCLGQSVEYDISQAGENLGYEWRSSKGFYSINPRVTLNKGDRYYATTTQYGVPTCSRTDTLELIDYATQIGNEIALDPRGNLRAWTVAVNTSYPPADSIRWVLPEAAEAEAGNVNRQYLYFKDTGMYTVGLYTYKGSCWAYGERSIQVINMSDMDPRDIPIDKKGIEDFLAFPNPNSGGQFTIWVDLFDIDDVEVWLATNPMSKIAQGSGQQYYRFNINQPLATGTYTLIVKTRHGERSFNIIVW